MYYRKHRDFEPWYDISADYNTNTKSYYDYLARVNAYFKTITSELNDLINRDIITQETPSIKLTKKGDWIGTDENHQTVIELSGDLKTSSKTKYTSFKSSSEPVPIINALTIEEDGAYSPNYLEALRALDSSIATNNSTINNIKHFGAVGDGLTDDTKVIKELLAKNMAIFIPNGVYLISENLYLPDGSALFFESNKAEFKRASKNCDYMFINGKNDQKFSGYNGNGNFVIVGGTINMNSLEYPQVNSAFMLRHSPNNYFKNLTILDTANGHAFDMNGTINQTFENVKCLGWRDVSIEQNLIAQEAWQLSTTAKDIFEWGTEDGTPNKNIVLNNCETGNSLTSGSSAYNAAIGNHSVYTTLNADTVILNNCKFTGGNYYAIRAYGINNLTANNTIVNDFTGFLAVHGQYGRVYQPNGNMLENTPSVVKNVNINNLNFTAKDLLSTRQCFIIQGAKNSKGEEMAKARNINLNNVTVKGVSTRITVGGLVENTSQVDLTTLICLDLKTGIRGTYNELLNISDIRFDHIEQESIYLTYTTFSQIDNIYAINTGISGSNGSISLEDGCKNTIIKNSVVRTGGLGKNRFGVYMDGEASYCIATSNYMEGTVGKTLVNPTNSHQGIVLSEGNKNYIVNILNGSLTVKEIK